MVKSRLDEIILNKIALEAGGLYTPSYGTKWGLEKIYKESIAKIEDTTYKTQRVKRYTDRYQIPPFVALILIVAEVFIPETRRSKVRVR